MSDDHDAAARDELKHGELEPILPGPGASDYERYLRTDELLALQKPPEEMVHRDERLFQTMHQSSELWLKLACFEIDEAIVLIGEGEIRRAPAAARARQPLHRDRDRGAAHARAPVALGVPRGADGAGARQRLRLAGIPEPAFDRSTALERVRGSARRERPHPARGLHAGASSSRTCTTSPRR